MKIELSLSKGITNKTPLETNKVLNENFISYIVKGLEVRRKMLNPGIYKVQKKEK